MRFLVLLFFWIFLWRNKLGDWLLRTMTRSFARIVTIKVFHLEDIPGRTFFVVEQQITFIKLNFIQYINLLGNESFVADYIKAFEEKGFKVDERTTNSHTFDLFIRNLGGPNNWQEKDRSFFSKSKNFNYRYNNL